MDRDADRRCSGCFGCQLVTKEVPPPPVKPTMLPKQPWEELAVDLMGALPSGEHLLVLVDIAVGWTLMSSKQPPARPLFVAWTPSSQGTDYLEVCVPSA